MASSKYNASKATIKLAEGLFSKVNIDAFYGDDIKGETSFSIYYNSVYQGELKTFIEIDKRPPASPELTSSAQGDFSREAVTLKLSAEEDAQIYYEIQTTKEQDEDSFTLALTNELNLNPIENKETFYYVKAYTIDKAGNKSDISSYSIVIDSYNYFVNANVNTDSEKANGSKEYPFNSLEAVIPYLNRKTPMRIQIEGTVSLPNKPVLIKADCEITGGKDARIIAEENSLLTILDTKIVIDNCILEKHLAKANSDTNVQTCFIELDNSSANIKNTELIAYFETTGTLIEVNKSTLTVQNSGITVQSSSYANAISAFDSELRLDGNRITSTANTAINFSIHEGFTELKNNTCSVIANLGRIAEFSNTTADISNNKFYSKLSDEKSISPIWQDDNTSIRLYRGNIEE
ncbi:MAG: hypothetical protein K6F69_08290 [Treponema sp.]|nr:hypothetical protein [Treponema sp.]